MDDGQTNPLLQTTTTADLDAYISRYNGYTKLRRLEWIAQRCPSLAADCYRAALALLRQGINTQSYREIAARAVQLMGPEHAEDTEWAEQVRAVGCVTACGWVGVSWRCVHLLPRKAGSVRCGRLRCRSASGAFRACLLVSAAFVPAEFIV